MTTKGRRSRVAIVGGGMAGLSTAYHLMYESPAPRPPEVRVFEASDRLGGIVRTVSDDGYVLDLGADSILTRKPAGVELARRLGLDDEMIPVHGELPALVLWEGKLHPLPPGWSLVAPLSWHDFQESRLFTRRGKARVAVEPLVPVRRGDGEESIASFVRRRLGREIVERVADPLLAGIFAGDPELLSIQQTFPRLVELERRHGSVIRGLQAARRAESADATVEADAAAGEPRRGPKFVSFRDGMQTLVDALVEAIAKRSPDALATGRRVEAVRPSRMFARGSPGGAFDLLMADGALWQADACVLAVPASPAAELVEGFDHELAAALRTIPYASTAAIYLGYPAGEIELPHATGFLVPHSQERRIFGCTFVSHKLDHRAPAGHALLRAFVGGRRRPQALEADDDELAKVAREELGELLGIDAEPDMTRVQRWPDANPQYEVGHAELLRIIDARLEEHPGLAIAGSSCRGTGVPDTVESGRRTAASLAGLLAGVAPSR